MWSKVKGLTVLGCLAALAATCDEGSEPGVLTLPVVADGSGLSAFVNAEGYTVELTEFRVALTHLELTVAGETHASLWQRLKGLVVSRAIAHPGHYAGGEVTGELLGDFVVDAFSGGEAPLGDASLLPGAYHGLNFTFRKATDADGLAADDPLLGHTLALAGTATRGTDTWTFAAVLDVDDGTRMVGAPFDLDVAAEVSATLVLRVLMTDPSTEADTAFDGVDFEALDPDRDGQVAIAPGDEAHNVLRRKVQVHDHWWLGVR